MDNMEIYNRGRSVPTEAKKPIRGGRLNGMTDVNPMWRIKRLTEIFGACGTGWWYEVIDKRIEEGANGEKCAFVDINLFYEYEGKVSHPVYGTGGSSFISKEKNGLYTSDECFKMALTDAISVAAKALGIAADVYFEKDRTKYDVDTTPDKPEAVSRDISEVMQFPEAREVHHCASCGAEITNTRFKGKEYLVENIVGNSRKLYGETLCLSCVQKKANANK